MRKILAGIATFALMAAPTFAAVSGVDVTNTGNGNDVTSTVSETQVTNVNQVNNTNVSSTVVGSVNTGGNVNSRNISTGGAGTTTQSGNAAMQVTNSVNAGQNSAAVSGNTGSLSGQGVQVVNAGDNNNVNATTVSTNVLNSNQVNNTSVAQVVTGSVNTGNNKNSRNIGNGVTNVSGNATLGVGLEVNAGTNGLQVMGAPSAAGAGHNLLGVTNTGNGNNATSVVVTNDVLNLNQVNNTSVAQFVVGDINTGGNANLRNIGDGNGIMSGNAGMLVGAEVNAGHNVAAVNQALPMGMGLVDFLNSGDCNTVTGVTATNFLTNIEGVNNLAQSQWVFGSTNTGYNVTKKSIGGSMILSGGAGLGAGLSVNAGMNNALVGGGLLMPWLMPWWM